MKKPFIIHYEAEGVIGLVIPNSDTECDIIWDDGQIKRKHELNWLSRNKVIKSNLTEQEVLAWRLKRGV
jgi:hypothetical protein